MLSATSGSDISAAEVQGVSPHGLWLLVMDREYFLPTAEFPWFADATVRDVYDVQLEHGHILHWPALDVDLELQSLSALEAWPLIWK